MILLLHYFLTVFNIAAAGFIKNDLYHPNFCGPSPLPLTDTMIDHAQHLIKSYQTLTSENLLSDDEDHLDPFDAASRLFYHPSQIVLSHGVQDHKDGPILNYGNSLALKRWGVSWEQLTAMPSSKTAEAMLQKERDQFMRSVKEKNLIRGYSGIRISCDGARFLIRNATVWNIIIDGKYLGQSATFSQWKELN